MRGFARPAERAHENVADRNVQALDGGADTSRLIASVIGQIALPRAVLVAAHRIVVLTEVGRRVTEIQDQAAAAQRLQQRGAGERLGWRLRGGRG